MEGEYLLFVALGPKVYGAIDIFGNSYTKVKGFKDTVELEILENLLSTDNKYNLNQEKWFKSISKSNIEIKDRTYQLKPTGNKRLLVYENNILSSTDNIILSNGEKIN